jgi:hypothetical protein
VAERYPTDLEHLQGGQSQPPNKPSVDLDFETRDGGNHHTVNVYQYDPKLAGADRARSRSNIGNWYTIDSRRSLAPHEFGHLIGLADEYNRTEEHYVTVTGEEPPIGDMAGEATDAARIASAIKAELPLNDCPIPPPGDERWGSNLAAVITRALGRNQGGFSRLVAQEYEKTYGITVYDDIKQAFRAVGVHRDQDNLKRCVTPFLYSNRGLMGTQTTVPPTGGG